jgi:hypothetical protein
MKASFRHGKNGRAGINGNSCRVVRNDGWYDPKYASVRGQCQTGLVLSENETNQECESRHRTSLWSPVRWP